MKSLDQKAEEQLKDAVAAAELPRTLASMSDNAHSIKQQLSQDPQNLQLIFRLGKAYCGDGLWNQACNVLHRGWARLSEVQPFEQRFEYAVMFCEASLRSGRKEIAREAVRKIDFSGLSQDQETLRSHAWSITCEIHGAMNERQLALKAFCQAIDRQPFEQTLAVWAATRASLRCVGAYDAGKATLHRAADTQEQKEKVDALDDFVAGADEQEPEEGQERKRRWQKG